MTIAGATSPVTLAGTVVQGLAEFLGVATALQVAAPGARLVFCFGSGVLDMLRTTFSLGCVESALMGAMATEVGHYLGVPTLNPGLSTDAKHAGLQTGYEKALKAATRLRRRPRHRLGLGPHRLAQHDVPAAVGGRQRDRRHGAAAQRRRSRSPTPRWPASHRRGRARAAASSARRTPRGASAPASTTCRRVSNRLSYEKWLDEGTHGDRRGLRAGRARCLAAHAARPPYLDGAQLDELAAICRVDDDIVRRARRE